MPPLPKRMKASPAANTPSVIAVVAQNGAHFDRLPIEIVEAILSKLDFVNLQRMRQVCRLWNEAAQSPFVRKTVIFDYIYLRYTDTCPTHDFLRLRDRRWLKAMWAKAAGPEVQRIILTNSQKRKWYIHLIRYGYFFHREKFQRQLFEPYVNLQELVLVHIRCADLLEADKGMENFAQVCRRVILIDVQTEFLTFDLHIKDNDFFVIPEAIFDLSKDTLRQYHETLDRFSAPLSLEEEEKIIAYMPHLKEEQVHALTLLMNHREPEVAIAHPGMVTINMEALRSMKPWTKRKLLFWIGAKRSRCDCNSDLEP